MNLELVQSSFLCSMIFYSVEKAFPKDNILVVNTINGGAASPLYTKLRHFHGKLQFLAGLLPHVCVSCFLISTSFRKCYTTHHREENSLCFRTAVVDLELLQLLEERNVLYETRVHIQFWPNIFQDTANCLIVSAGRKKGSFEFVRTGGYICS